MNSEELHAALVQLGFDLEPSKRLPSYAYAELIREMGKSFQLGKL